MDPTTDTSKLDMKVLVLGLPRCATTSLAAALESNILSIKPTLLHAPDTSGDKTKNRLVLDALHLQGENNLALRRTRLTEYCSGYAACTEPLNALADDLMDLYPTAKLILNIRPPPRSGEPADTATDWARSCRETIGFFGSFWALMICFPLQQYCFWWHRCRLQTDVWRRKGLLPRKASGLFASKGCEWMTAEFYDWYLEWVEIEARERGRDILLWHAGMGWEPLCGFLGRDVPLKSTAFPWLNDRAASGMRQYDYVLGGLFWYAVFVIMVGYCLWSHPMFFYDLRQTVSRLWDQDTGCKMDDR
ncbi:hypothetical protein BDW59DRAFT_143800 [Aspergillus cavernicola]|uniref:NAD dependent epimerase/dehydratase n=1 Tax=Aspergillus cavernicola TaxID=176166 RepID=A0ABR4IJ25_9EURO